MSKGVADMKIKTGILFIALIFLAGCSVSSEDLPKALFKKGKKYYESRKYDEAISNFTKVIELSPNNAGAYYFRGLASKEKGEFDKAISDLTKSIDLNSKASNAYYELGGIYHDKGYTNQDKQSYDQAILNYTKTIELAPFFGVYFNRGLVYQNIHEYDKAISDFTKSIELNKEGQGYPYEFRAKAYYQKKEYAKAWEDVHRGTLPGSGYEEKFDPQFIEDLKKTSGRES